jgi:hypothetical protein
MMRFQALLLALVASSTTVVNGQVIKLTEANYAELTAGKTVFIKVCRPFFTTDVFDVCALLLELKMTYF